MPEKEKPIEERLKELKLKIEKKDVTLQGAIDALRSDTVAAAHLSERLKELEDSQKTSNPKAAKFNFENIYKKELFKDIDKWIQQIETGKKEAQEQAEKFLKEKNLGTETLKQNLETAKRIMQKWNQQKDNFGNVLSQLKEVARTNGNINIIETIITFMETSPISIQDFETKVENVNETSFEKNQYEYIASRVRAYNEFALWMLELSIGINLVQLLNSIGDEQQSKNIVNRIKLLYKNKKSKPEIPALPGNTNIEQITTALAAPIEQIKAQLDGINGPDKLVSLERSLDGLKMDEIVETASKVIEGPDEASAAPKQNPWAYNKSDLKIVLNNIIEKPEEAYNLSEHVVKHITANVSDKEEVEKSLKLLKLTVTPLVGNAFLGQGDWNEIDELTDVTNKLKPSNPWYGDLQTAMTKVANMLEKQKAGTIHAQKKEMRQEIVKKWITKFIERLNSYVWVPEKDKKPAGWSRKGSTQLPFSDDKKLNVITYEFTQALYDARIDLPHLNPRKPAEIATFWNKGDLANGLNKNYSQIKKALDKKNKDKKLYEGRTEQILYILYGLLHSSTDTKKLETELKKVIKEAGSLITKLSGATIHKCNAELEKLYKEINEFLKQPPPQQSKSTDTNKPK